MYNGQMFTKLTAGASTTRTSSVLYQILKNEMFRFLAEFENLRLQISWSHFWLVSSVHQKKWV